MVRRIYLILLLLFCYSSMLFAQNLVQNPSFEECKKIPTRHSQLMLARGWYKHKLATLNTPDYFHRQFSSLSLHTASLKVPDNVWGYQEPMTGDAYAGFYADSQENIGGTLLQKLEMGKYYKIEFSVSLADLVSCASNDIGCYMSVNKIAPVYKKHWRNKKKKVKCYTNNPQVYLKNGSYITNKEEWTTISGIYRAKGGEKFIFIGGYNSYNRNEMKNINRKWGKCEVSYYYLDDVSVVECDSLGNILQIETVKDTANVIISDTTISETDSVASQLLKTEKGEKLILKNIQFEKNKSELLPSSSVTIEKLFNFLNDNTIVKIEILGHTDNTGNESINKQLSLARAKAVNDFLVNKNISQSRITYKGYGSKQAISGNDTEQGRKENRRVEILILEK